MDVRARRRHVGERMDDRAIRPVHHPLEALQDADVTVYPSINEVFGLVPLESILAGTPVVVCNDDGCGQVIRKTGGGDLIPWGDHNALTYAIRRRLQEGKDSAELQMAQEKIRLHFNWHLIALEVVQFYQAAQVARASNSQS